MDVRESPTVRHWPPGAVGPDGDKYGQFVILAIDLSASVAFLEDDASLQAALQLPNDHYLAYALTTGTVLREADDGYFKLTLQFYLVSRGLPVDHPDESVPIAPTTYHPLGREPVYPTSPLPWDNLYISTTSSFEALVSRIHYGRGLHPARMPRATRNAVFTITFEDLEKVRLSKLPAHVPTAPPVQKPAAPPLPKPTDDDEYSTDPGSRTTDTSSHPSAPQPEPDPLKLALQRVYAKSLGAEKFVELWLDIEAACPNPDLLGHPDRLNDVSRQLIFIWKDWEEQAVAEVMAKRPQTGTWAQGVAAGAPDMDVDSPPGRESIDEGGLGPEDAIDEQIERAELARNAPHPAKVALSDSARSATVDPTGSQVPDPDAMDEDEGAPSHTPNRLRKLRLSLSRNTSHAVSLIGRFSTRAKLLFRRGSANRV